ncbi:MULTISPECIES: rod shape-determining protein MreD [unclassified Fusibacter]|uniref:rod shape-determining protein MreD n=1 Tax=unclassified Fusibacter TaxID=2624464 RepID=UPI001011D43E|nr:MULTISPECIES: rod shape-determining protein MreD [unclassified Fusibacter]MCK8060670.1 rod shape-determining protein MreD [Fusibacter sp. A2]NPE22876.1 rod shape-determining protein MreD [Fusibacter sp. A1]RXV59945.1 rod shape-determining protein MreD [Fusibacter sp. A1]
MKDRYLIAITLAIVVLQTTVLQLLRIGGVLPNLMLIWLIIAIVLFGRFVGIRTAIYAGLFSDILIGKGLAVHLSIYLVIAIIISSMEEKIFKDNYVTPVVLIMTTTVFYHVFFLVVHYFATGNINLLKWVFTITLPEMIYNLAIGVVVYTQSFKWQMGYRMR